MSRIGVALIMRGIVMGVTFLALTVAALIGWQLVEPWAAAFDAPGAGLPTPASLLPFLGVGTLALPVVLFLWYWFAPVRDDRRQQYAGPPRR